MVLRRCVAVEKHMYHYGNKQFVDLFRLVEYSFKVNYNGATEKSIYGLVHTVQVNTMLKPV